MHGMPNGNRHPAVQPTTGENVVAPCEIVEAKVTPCAAEQRQRCLPVPTPLQRQAAASAQRADWRVGITRAAAPSPSQVQSELYIQHTRW